MSEQVTSLPPGVGIQIRSRSLTKEKDAVTQQVLMPGDNVAYQVTHQVNYDNGETMWVKVGTSTTKTPGETDQEAADRVVTFVHATAEQAIKDAVHAARTITL